MSYRPMVEASGEWAGNLLRFATEEEATASARDLYHRWFLAETYGCEWSDDPVTYRWDEEKGNVKLEALNV